MEKVDIVDQETAELDVLAWLDKKKVFEGTRELYSDSIDLLTEAVRNGTLTLDKSNYVFTHKLLFATSGEAPLEELKYVSRINDNALKQYMQGVKSADADGRLTAYIAALTKTAKGIITSLDSADKKIAMAIAVFFL